MIEERDAGWSHEFRSDLYRIDRYAGCWCEVVVTDLIGDLSELWPDLEADRDALWNRIRELSEYDLAEAQARSCGDDPAG